RPRLPPKVSLESRSESPVKLCPRNLNDPQHGLRRKCTIIKGDICDSALVDDVLSAGHFDFIFHLASYATVIEKAIDSPLETIETNTIGTVNILESIRRHRLSPLRIIHASTDKVYGEMDGEPYEEEKTPLKGIGLYDSSKLAADLLIRTYHEVYGLPTVVLRLCNIFGPADFNTKHRLIPRALASLYGQRYPRPPELYFDSIDHWRDYLYIDDLLRVFLHVAFRDECTGETFNVAAARFASTPEVLKLLVEMASEIESEFDPIRAERILSGGISVRIRPQNSSVLKLSKQRLNGNKLTRMTGFEPSVTFNEGLSRTICAYREYYLGLAQPEADGITKRSASVQVASPIQPSAA
ncbi:MAG: GDP-mannose 4,6-dehydratase, partial [Hyphomicrobium sp.]|nr:GDP-mannose 4,6-dehydratase [Hyphomicrobium sp.]